MRFETDPKDSGRTTVIFDTVEELIRASQLDSLGNRILYYFALSGESAEPEPLPGAVADENGWVLPAKTETPISNRRLLNAANRLLKRSLSQSSLAHQYSSPDMRSADQAFAHAINNHFGNPDDNGGLQGAEVHAS